MRIEAIPFVAATLAGCSSVTPQVDPDPVSVGGARELPADLPVPSSAPATEPTAAVPSASSPAPAASSSPTATVYRCDELVKLCHDVGHSGGETGRCHELGHAHDEGACVTGFDRCKTACEAAAKKAAGHKHAH